MMSDWDSLTPTEVTSAFLGFSVPKRELYAEIEKRGWEVKNVAFKSGRYTAKGKSPIGLTVEASGPTDDSALGNLLMMIMRHEFVTPSHTRTSAWHEHFTKPGVLKSIAEAYAKAPVYDPKAAPAWKELAEDSRKRADEIRKQIRVEVVDDPEPYADAHEMQEDIHKNRHFYVSRANSDHPIWSPEDNVNFRIVHDVLGHAPSGGNFDWTGENQACGQHFPLLSPTAQKALHTECIGQTGYAAYYRDFGPQKICFLNDHIEPVQALENKPGHQGVHPSQSLVGTSGPEIPTPDYEGFGAKPDSYVPPHMEPLGLSRAYLGSVSGYQPDETAPEEGEWVREPDPSGVYPDGIATGWRQAHGVLVRDALHSWKGWPSDMMLHAHDERNGAPQPSSGGGKQRRSQAAALLHELAHNPSTPTGPLYRGSHVAPSGVTAWSEDPKVAKYWASKNGGKVHTLDPSNVRGLRIADYIDSNANESEREWLVDHPGDVPKRESAIRDAFPVDPNEGWQSGVDPLPNNAYMWQKHPVTGAPPLNIDATNDLAHKLSTDWHKMDRETAKQAVVNAVRAAVLSPKQDLRWNAVNYQDVRDIHHSVEDPKRYWDALQVSRERWNGARGHEARSHKPWYPAFVKFKQMLKATLHKHDDEIHDIAERELMNMHVEEQERLLRGKPDMDTFDLEGKTDKALKTRLEVMTKANYSPDLDHGQMQMFGAEEQLSLPLDMLPPNPGKYRAGFAGNAKSLAAIGKHADELTDAAIKDVNEHNGSGHHFRASILSMGIRGVGPKVASFAWLLLQPVTSQLGTMDSHMAKYVGTDPENFSTRDYFRAERQLQAGRDAAGYGHVPLGQFQWSMWDSKRTGNPQDHSALSPLAPTPHHEVFWEPPARDGDWETPNWWNDTQPARDHVGHQFDKVISTQFGPNKIPFQKSAAKTAPQIPYFINGKGESVSGQGGQSLMNHLKNQFGLSTQEIWKLPHEVGKQ